MKNLLLFILLIPSLGFALEVDEKLTARIVKTSESKKTVMLNRGTEDGLVEGDHAKFIVTAGIVARGVVVKVSPTRSVWSVYRLVNADFITNDSVMSIKITPPVKITKDESQALVQEDTPTQVTGDATTLGIPLADGAQDLSAAAADSAVSNTDLKSLEENDAPASIVERNMEVYGFLNLSSLTAKSEDEAGANSVSNSQAFQHIGIGGEFYPRNERAWYSKFSALAEVALMKENSQSYNGSGVTNDITEFSFGANWHPTTLPSVAGEFIPYVHGTVNIGTVQSTLKGGIESSSNGATNGFSIGGGFKFYTLRGFGARMLLDYYVRAEKYKEDDSAVPTAYNKSVAGPRLMFAFSYRF